MTIVSNRVTQSIHRTHCRVGINIAALFLSVVSPSAAQGRPDLDALIAQATAYVEDFVRKFSNVVAEERYVQDVVYAPQSSLLSSDGSGNFVTVPSDHRELRSEFLLVRTSEVDDWLTFRDVVEVDGKPIGRPDDRLTKLFSEGGSAIERATRVASESARYNLLGSARTVNDPLLALALLQRRYRSRFRFTLRDVDRNVGPDAWAVDFQERERPSMLQGRIGVDGVVKGRLWIDRVTGRVLKTDLVVGTAVHVVTSFRFDEAFGIAVPFRMDERYAVESRGDFVVKGQATGTALYGRFRQFSVRTEEKLQ
jgi:hypothetical protein